MSKYDSEQELAAVFVEYLTSEGWDVYQEVNVAYGGRTADIVALREPVSIVVEVKLSFGLTVIEQAVKWKNFTNYTYIAVPRPKAGKEPRTYWFAKRIAEMFGCGVITAYKDYEGKSIVDIEVAPKLHRIRKADILNIRHKCTEAQKTWKAAGEPGGGRWSPFQQTKKLVQAFVAAHPGCTTKEMIDGIDHHYHRDSTARACISAWINRGVIDGIRVERKGRTNHLFSS